MDDIVPSMAKFLAYVKSAGVSLGLGETEVTRLFSSCVVYVLGVSRMKCAVACEVSP